MQHVTLAAIMFLATTLITPALAGSEDVVIEDPWARAAIGTDRPGAAYMSVRNTGDATVTLTGLKTPLAMRAEIHQTTTDAAGVSSMAPAGAIVIPPGDSATLKPGGLHAMLMKLQAPMTEGEMFPLTLVFSDGGEVTIDVPVLSVAARGPSD